MLDCYTAALAAYYKSQNPLLTGLPPDDPKYLEVRHLRDRAFEALFRARKIYWDHVAEHECRRAVSPDDPSADRRG
jgi:hypothetical protein